MRTMNKVCCVTAAVASFAAVNAFAINIAVKNGDISLDANWSGGVAPGASDTAGFGVAKDYCGPYTMSKNMTFSRFNSGGWGLFTDNPQVFDLKGYTMTLTDNSEYAFAPCNSGPRNHLEFSNGKIAFSNGGYFIIGYNSASYSGEWLKLSGIEMTGAALAMIGAGDGGNFNCEMKVERGSKVSIAGNVELSPNGLSSATAAGNRLIVDSSTFSLGATLRMGGGGLLEVMDGGAFTANMIYSGNSAGSCRTLVSNATVSCSWSYESGLNASCTSDDTEVMGESAKLSAGRIRVGGSSSLVTTLFLHDGATLEGTAATVVGNSGPAQVTVSNANLKARELLVGSVAAAAQSRLRILGSSSSLAITYSDNGHHDFFGKGGRSSIEIGQGANLSLWEKMDRVDIDLGTASANNVLEVAGNDTVYNAPWEYLTVGTKDYDGTEVRVLDGAVYTIRRLSITGENAFIVSNATVNIGHSDDYHTSIMVSGGRLMVSGAQPKINFSETMGRGGVKVFPGAKIVFDLPAEPYAVTPIETFWLNLTYDDNNEIGEIDVDVSKIPADHDRLKYKLASVVETQWLHQDAIDRVNNLDSVKAVKGKLAWVGKDLVFTVPGTKGLSITVR